MIFAPAEGKVDDPVGMMQAHDRILSGRLAQPAGPTIDRARPVQTGGGARENDEIVAHALQVPYAQTFEVQKPPTDRLADLEPSRFSARRHL
jgi:hypothetical protein